MSAGRTCECGNELPRSKSQHKPYKWCRACAKRRDNARKKRYWSANRNRLIAYSRLRYRTTHPLEVRICECGASIQPSKSGRRKWCSECARRRNAEGKAKHYALNKDRYIRRSMEWQARNRKKVNAWISRWKAANKALVREYRKRSFGKNRLKEREQNKRWIALHQQQVKAARKARYDTNADADSLANWRQRIRTMVRGLESDADIEARLLLLLFRQRTGIGRPRKHLKTAMAMPHYRSSKELLDFLLNV